MVRNDKSTVRLVIELDWFMFSCTPEWVKAATTTKIYCTTLAGLHWKCMCMRLCGHIPKHYIERMKMVHFKFQHMLKLLKIHVQCKLTQWTPHYLTSRWWIYWMRQRTPHCVTQHRWIYWVPETDCVWSERKGLLLDTASAPKRTVWTQWRVLFRIHEVDLSYAKPSWWPWPGAWSARLGFN